MNNDVRKNASLTLLRGNKGWTWLMKQGKA